MILITNEAWWYFHVKHTSSCTISQNHSFRLNQTQTSWQTADAAQTRADVIHKLKFITEPTFDAFLTEDLWHRPSTKHNRQDKRLADTEPAEPDRRPSRICRGASGQNIQRRLRVSMECFIILPRCKLETNHILVFKRSYIKHIA